MAKLFNVLLSATPLVAEQTEACRKFECFFICLFVVVIIKTVNLIYTDMRPLVVTRWQDVLQDVTGKVHAAGVWSQTVGKHHATGTTVSEIEIQVTRLVQNSILLSGMCVSIVHHCGNSGALTMEFSLS